MRLRRQRRVANRLVKAERIEPRGEVADTPAVRGMINRVSYLVKVEE